jgi:hypothetical protein
LRNFDQWTEALTRDISIQNNEDNAKLLWRMDEIFDEDMEEEE